VRSWDRRSFLRDRETPAALSLTFRRWLPAASSAAGALCLSVYLAVRGDQVDIDVYRMGGRHVFAPDLYTVHFGNSGLLFTYPPFAALLFAFVPRTMGIWSVQCIWAITNVAVLAGLIYLSIRIVVPELGRKQAARWALLLLLPALALNPVFTTVGLGQINLLLCLIVLWDLATDRKIGTHSLPLGVATGFAAAVKLTPLIFVPYLIVTRRVRGARNAVVTFVACEAVGFFVSPADSWAYWSKDVFDSRRAGALLYSSDQNLSSVVQRIHHGPVSAVVLVPALVAIAVGGLALAASAHRRSSPVLGVLVCATTGLIISPITWVHHLVWIVPAIIWLAVGADRPRRGPLLAGLAAALFLAAPIWWVPTSWRVTNHPPELHQNHWQLLAGNSFLFAMLVFLAGVAVMLAGRRGTSPSTTQATQTTQPRTTADVGHCQRASIGAPADDRAAGAHAPARAKKRPVGSAAGHF
jgi:alpha-1,2-mannosyltransferase